jgi:Raf kinase inhibitor-like YbhB/YbcL family protein
VGVGALSQGARTLVFELLDSDAPGGTFTHWLRYSVLDQNAFHEGVNSFGKVGYSGPCPPPGQTHHYHLVVMALDRPLSLSDGFTRAQLEAEVAKGSVLNRGEIVATYRR